MKSNTTAVHKSVLTEELTEKLDISPKETVVDGTINGGGHAAHVCELIGKGGLLIGIDMDEDALEKSRKRLEGYKCRKRLLQENFRDLTELLQKTEVDKVYFDLGMSSDQLEESERGFSFRKEEPLIMTFEKNPPKEKLTAKEIVNEWPEEDLANVIFAYGGEKAAKKIAKAIVNERAEGEITNTAQLAEIVEEAMPGIPEKRKLHPARKTFQALRIAVNDELEAIKAVLPQTMEVLVPQGRIAVISFHELEDRIIKNYFKQKQKEENGQILTKKPIVPSRQEIQENPRAKSAKLRVFKKY